MCGQSFDSKQSPAPRPDGRPRYNVGAIDPATASDFLVKYIEFRENHDGDRAVVDAAYERLREEAAVGDPDNAARKIADILREELLPEYTVNGPSAQINIRPEVGFRIRKLVDATRR